MEAQLRVQHPKIGPDDHFVDVVQVLAIFFVDEITLPSTYEQFRTTSAGQKLRDLVDHLVLNVTNPVLISALLSVSRVVVGESPLTDYRRTLKWHFSALETEDPRLNETRATACELVASRFLTRLSERDAVDACLHKIPRLSGLQARTTSSLSDITERSTLLPRYRSQDGTIRSRPGSSRREDLQEAVNSIAAVSQPTNQNNKGKEDPTSAFIGLTGLQIAVVADCKRFLSQALVQKIVTGIWRGDIVFWGNLHEHARKKSQFYHRSQSDPYSRLRVPRYLKISEFAFFVTFLFFYSAVLVEHNMYHVTVSEGLLYIWLASFMCAELSQFIGAGTMVYAVDLWNGFDMTMLLIGAAFIVTRLIGLATHNDKLIDTAFDILSLEALFMVPRICSLLSILPYFATLIPCLKAMIKDFFKFMVIVGILYLGFLTTFTLLARKSFTLGEMSWTLTRIFFGGSALGFAIMHDINPTLGPPLMVIFVCMTNILLITSLVCVMRQSFAKVFANAREEQLYVYSVYVLEASTSNSITHFYPPLNLIPLLFIQPFRLIFSADQLRKVRIQVLKISHSPIVGLIWIYERLPWKVYKSGEQLFSSHIPQTTQILIASSKAKMKGQSTVHSHGISGSSSGEDLCMVKPSTQSELEEKVEALSAQIAELAALIVKSQDKGRA
ncbi:Uncharacterized protein BP5553_10254 [Venustampulla echinocandica]|uniref:Calcium channel YVC1-like C-terminal transmembrane domain-containing protein n=1 Tax=Venustampulla echinocandica TaxID=2656787 RepID=A0A370T9Q9_9HELO|nr:Uncharacterized protein BP5553_10254 [Venustampulla echinocandica]RDL30376.1 Uncharacterized protein BP5553_10254 [Venustampulla echinocandica]